MDNVQLTMMVSPLATDFNHFRRLRPQTRFGAQPAKTALGAEINTTIVNCQLLIVNLRHRRDKLKFEIPVLPAFRRM
jgi:hypothetical protein